MPKKQKNKLPPFVPMLWSILNSAAYRDLPFAARSALIYFQGKVQARDDIGNYIPYKSLERYKLEFYFSYGEAKRYGFAVATFAKCIRALVSKGFIDPVAKGGLRGDRRSYNYFKLSLRWIDYGTDKFMSIEWSSFQPKIKVKKTETTSKSETIRFKKGNNTHAFTRDVSLSEVVGSILG
ncbi:MAG: hypothetical protein WA277_05310 [Nitrospirota bacterium]